MSLPTARVRVARGSSGSSSPNALPTNQAAADFLRRMKDDMKAAEDRLAQAQARQERNANRHRRDEAFNPGDRVFLSTANLTLRTDGPAAKFNPRWTGPFKVLERIGKVAYRLELPPRMRVHPVFHVSLLKTYQPDAEATEAANREEQLHRPPPIEGSAIYEVERILDKRVTMDGRRKLNEYLIQWKGYPIYEATWEPSRHLLGSDVLRMKRAFDAANASVSGPL